MHDQIWRTALKGCEMKNLVRFVFVSSLLSGVFGCSTKSSEKAVTEARGEAADGNARAMSAAAQLKAAEARVAAANASVEALDADTHVKTTTTPAASILQMKDRARGLIVNMSDVLFDTGKYSLKSGAREKLAKISGIVLANPSLALEVEGHSDSVGSDDFNLQLSENRADSVRDFLIGQGIVSSAIGAHGYGASQPVASNDTATGRQQNRRVELIVSGEVIGKNP